jgi:hypothetical protein
MTSPGQGDRIRAPLPMVGQRVRAIKGSAITGTIISLREDSMPRVRWDNGVEQDIAREKLAVEPQR